MFNRKTWEILCKTLHWQTTLSYDLGSVGVSEESFHTDSGASKIVAADWLSVPITNNAEFVTRPVFGGGKVSLVPQFQ